MVFQPSRLHAYATAVAFASGISSSMFASALTAYSVSDCADLAPFTTGETLTDDGIDFAKGGHIWTSGAVTVGGFVNLRDGFSRQDGGAVYIATGGSLDVDGLVTLERNSATESCDDVYPC